MSKKLCFMRDIDTQYIYPFSFLKLQNNDSCGPKYVAE